jgi:tetratricopeptide (TPR) repeat protein
MKLSYLSCLFIVVILQFSACNSKTKVDTSKSESEKAADERMDRMMTLYNNQNYAAFIEMAVKELELSDRMNRLLVPLADAHGQIGDFESAFYVVRTQLKWDSTDYNALLLVGNMHNVQERLDSAEIYYKRVIELNPAYARAYLNLAMVYEKQDKKQEAINQYLEAVTLFDLHDFKDEVVKFSNKVFELDSTNLKAKYYLEKVKK